MPTFDPRDAIDGRAVRGDDLCDRVARHVEQQMVGTNAPRPERRQKLRPFDRSRVQEPIATGGIRGNGEGISRWIGEANVGMFS